MKKQVVRTQEELTAAIQAIVEHNGYSEMSDILGGIAPVNAKEKALIFSCVSRMLDAKIIGLVWDGYREYHENGTGVEESAIVLYCPIAMVN